MGTIFLIDGHTPVLADSEINDTIPLEFGDAQTINGSFVVNVPFAVPIDGTPMNLTDLLNDKFTGMLAFYPGYTYIDYDEGVDATNWDTANSQGAILGDRGNVSVQDGGIIQSSAVSLTGSAPSVAVLTWEVFVIDSYTNNAKDGVQLRRYTEGTPADLTISASFDNGSSWVSSITDGVQFNIPIFQQGTQFLIRMSNSSGQRLWVGSWAVIY